MEGPTLRASGVPRDADTAGQETKLWKPLPYHYSWNPSVTRFKAGGDESICIFPLAKWGAGSMLRDPYPSFLNGQPILLSRLPFVLFPNGLIKAMILPLTRRPLSNPKCTQKHSLQEENQQDWHCALKDTALETLINVWRHQQIIANSPIPGPCWVFHAQTVLSWRNCYYHYITDDEIGVERGTDSSKFIISRITNRLLDPLYSLRVRHYWEYWAQSYVCILHGCWLPGGQ